MASFGWKCRTPRIRQGSELRAHLLEARALASSAATVEPAAPGRCSSGLSSSSSDHDGSMPGRRHTMRIYLSLAELSDKQCGAGFSLRSTSVPLGEARLNPVAGGLKRRRRLKTSPHFAASRKRDPLVASG